MIYQSKIRNAIPEYGAAACQVMRRSITELHAANHWRHFETLHLPIVALMPSQTAPTRPVTMIVMTALNV